MSIPSVTLVATRTTSASYTDPVTRFQQAVDAQLAIADLERRVQRLERQLNLGSRIQAHPIRGSRRSAWWPDP